MSEPRGREAIDFAYRFMPALQAATTKVKEGGLLDGRRVGIALTLEPKTACLVEAVASLGARVSVLGSSHSTKPAVASALTELGIDVFAEAGAGPDRIAELRDHFIDTGLEYLCDDGATVVRQIHGPRRDMLPRLLGAAEETTSGVRPLRVMEEQGALEVPCVAVNDARTKLRFDNVYGTGQSVVLATVDRTDRQMAGSRVVVVGYGHVGKGIAASARALGGRVSVTEIDPVEALAAHHDGFRVVPLSEAMEDADFVFTATGVGHTLTGSHVSALPDGAIVAVGGAGPPEFDPSLGTQVAVGDEVRPGVNELRVGDGRTVYLIAGGYCANTSAGEGNPIEIMDLSLALQLRALEYLASTDLGPGVHLLPSAIDDAVALSQLTAAGITIDSPTVEQKRWVGDW